MIYAVIGSVTTAGRLARKMQEAGDLSARVVHTPSEFNNGGCSYSVKTAFCSAEPIYRIANTNRIRIKRCYRENYVNGRKVYNAISG